MSNGDLAGNNKAYSMERIETVVNGQWQTKGIWHYEDWNYESVRVWDTDLFTGEVIDTENDWKEFGKLHLSLIHISEPTRRTPISYAVFCLKKKKKKKQTKNSNKKKKKKN